MKSAVINRETTVVENIIMADPSDPWPYPDTFLVLVPDDLPVNIGDTYVNPYFYDTDGNIIMSIPPEEIIEPSEEIVEEVDNGS
jgi:hypothetical protein